MNKAVALIAVGCWICGAAPAHGQEETLAAMPPLSERVTIAGGMAVSYISAPDVVGLIDFTPGAEEQLPAYKTGIQFFGLITVPMFPKWTVKAEYSYLLASYNISSEFGPGGSVDYTLTANLPSVILQYILVDKPEYTVRIGAGVGYHFGKLSTTFFGQELDYTATGIGTVLEIEGMTAVSEHIFALLGANLRWEWIGTLKDPHGHEPTYVSGSTTMTMFAPSVKIGFAYAL